MTRTPAPLLTKRQVAAITTRLVTVTSQDYRLTRDDRGVESVLCKWSTPSCRDVVLAISTSSERGLYSVSLGRNSGSEGVVTMGATLMTRRALDALVGDPGQVVGVFFGQRRLQPAG